VRRYYADCIRSSQSDLCGKAGEHNEPSLREENYMKLAFGITLAIVTCSAFAADEYTRGYTRKDGTYVQPHHSTPDNQNRYDNYSARGNTNPYTGERGSQRHEFTNPPAYNQPRSNGLNRR
jgi:hypothetical protein